MKLRKTHILLFFLLISGQAIFSQQLTLTKLEELCLSTQLEVSSKYLIKEGWESFNVQEDSVVRNGTVTILKPVSTFDLNCSIFSVNNLP